MNFEWDDDKRLTNITKHGFDFVDIDLVFEGLTVTILDDRFDYGENRFVTLGLYHGYVVVVAHLENDRTIRIISVRKANSDEEKRYYKTISD